MFPTALLALALSLSASLVTAAPHAHADHSHELRGALPEIVRAGGWAQDRRSETAKMFLDRRAAGDAVGSQGWVSNYPAPGATPPTSSLPQAWLDRLKAVTGSATFPTFGPSTSNNGYPTYKNNESGASADVCSFTYQCTTQDDIYNGPNGTVSITFDDGPTPFSPKLYDFLEANKIQATHFLIGGNIVYNSGSFMRIFKDGGHLAVHTWSHPYMTTLSNEAIVAELGWTMQIIADSTGLVPAFWRPPYGDVDNRVRMIAKEVFGIIAVAWNQDTGDWAIGSNPAYTVDSVTATYENWLKGNKNPGLVLLEHEASDADIQVFMNVYPKLAQYGWVGTNVADNFKMPWYLNSQSNSSGTTSPSILQTSTPGNRTQYKVDYALSGSSASASASSAVSSAASSAVVASTSGSSAATSASVTGSAASVATSAPGTAVAASASSGTVPVSRSLTGAASAATSASASAGHEVVKKMGIVGSAIVGAMVGWNALL